MNSDRWQVPWQSRTEFDEIRGFFSCIDQRRSGALFPVRELAQDIERRFDRMTGDLDSLCCLTCPNCRDNCCNRALIWYDFKDLLYLYFGPDRMPDRQIEKIYTKSGNRCPNFGPSGCSLPRARRPFVCTWYFCPVQKALPQYRLVRGIVEEIKVLRVRMEEAFCRITGGGRQVG